MAKKRSQTWPNNCSMSFSASWWPALASCVGTCTTALLLLHAAVVGVVICLRWRCSTFLLLHAWAVTLSHRPNCWAQGSMVTTFGLMIAARQSFLKVQDCWLVFVPILSSYVIGSEYALIAPRMFSSEPYATGTCIHNHACYIIAWGKLPIDLFIAGFPCQPFSKAGKGEGIGDSQQRGVIIFFIIRWIAEHLPKTFLLENVAGLTTVHLQTFLTILGMLKMIKYRQRQAYDIQWKVRDFVNSSYSSTHEFWSICLLGCQPTFLWRGLIKVLNCRTHGHLPQNRERVFIVGIRCDCQQSAFAWPKEARGVCLRFSQFHSI